MTYICRNCGEEKRTTINPKGHSFADGKVEPTCTKDGQEYKQCVVCGYIDESTIKVIPATGHDWEKIDDLCVAPACTEDGYDLYRCGKCGEERREAIPATGHEYALMVKSSTCTEQGRMYNQCIHDGYIDPDSIALLPLAEHEYEWYRITNSKTGVVTDRKICKVCGEVAEEITIIENGGGSSSYEYQSSGTVASVSEIAKKALEDGCEKLEVSFDNGVTVVIDNKNLSLFTVENAKIDVSEIKTATDALTVAGYDFGDENAKFAAYEITASATSVEKGTLATVRIEFDLEEGMKQVVYYVNAEGKKERIKSTYKDGVVTFSTSHFSTYVVEQTKAGIGGVAIAIIAIVAVLLATAGTFGYMVLMAKKRKTKKRVRF